VRKLVAAVQRCARAWLPNYDLACLLEPRRQALGSRNCSTAMRFMPDKNIVIYLEMRAGRD
jgi:hypothetical protein